MWQDHFDELLNQQSVVSEDTLNLISELPVMVALDKLAIVVNVTKINIGRSPSIDNMHAKPL